jgi:DNA-binding MarR family transcriptional regulator
MSDTPPALTMPEELFWRSLMRLVITVPRAMDKDLERSCGVSGTEYLVLMHLSEASASKLRMSDLAVRTALSASRITRVVDGMMAEGLVEKKPCAEDRRATQVTLTSQGLARLRDAYRHHLQSVRHNIFDHLTDAETAAVGPVLDRLAGAVDAENPPPAGRFSTSGRDRRAVVSPSRAARVRIARTAGK